MTYFLLVAVALAIGGIGFLLRRRSTALGQGLILVSCLGLVGILGWQVRGSFSAGDAKPPNRAHAVVSFYLANQTQTVIAGHRGVVVMVLPPAGALDAETAESYANAPALRAARTSGMGAGNRPSGRAGESGASGKIPLTAFQQLTARHPATLAFVCLAQCRRTSNLCSRRIRKPPSLGFSSIRRAAPTGQSTQRKTDSIGHRAATRCESARGGGACGNARRDF